MDSRIQINSVVQINENGQDGWIGCLVQVSELKSWGIQGWVKLPKSGDAYIRLNWNEIDYIGEAVMTQQKEIIKTGNDITTDFKT
jgi:hypothetical protein